MTTSTSLLIVLAFLAVSTRATDVEGVSRLCEESRLYPSYYGPLLVECCDDRGGCDKYIEPKETKYGLYNPEIKWSRRLCSCDQILFHCVLQNKSLVIQMWYTETIFGRMKCFREKPSKTNEISNTKKYEFVPFKNEMPHLSESR